MARPMASATLNRGGILCNVPSGHMMVEPRPFWVTATLTWTSYVLACPATGSSSYHPTATRPSLPATVHGHISGVLFGVDAIVMGCAHRFVEGFHEENSTLVPWR